MTPVEIAAKLTKAQREAWRRAEWCGDYFLPPDEICSDRAFYLSCLSLGLVCKSLADGEIEVTVRGHELAAYLQSEKPRRGMWQRFRAILEQEARDGR